MGLKSENRVYAAMGGVVGCDFPVKEELSRCIAGFLEYRYRCIITIKLLSEQITCNDLVELGIP